MIENKIIIHIEERKDILEDFIYLTNKVIKSDNNSSYEQLEYKYTLQDKFKFKYNINTYELFYNIGIISKYLNDLEK